MPEMTPTDPIERAIEEALEGLRTAAPSADFLPRLRTQIETLDRSRLPRWCVPAAAVAAAIVIAFAVGYNRGVRDAPAPLPLASSSVGTQTAAPQAIERTLTRAPEARPVRARRAAGAPQVLVPASERLAITRLVDALQAGRPDALSMVRSAAANDAPAPLDTPPLIVPPIRIEPVVVSTFPGTPPISDK